MPGAIGRRHRGCFERIAMIMSQGAQTPASGGPAVEVDAVSKRFGRTLALDGISLSVGRGEAFALLGPNGAGKSTLIHILCTILAPDGGTARIAGEDVKKRARQARRHLGVVFQEPSLDGRLTVEENLQFHGLVFQVPARLRRERIAEMLELVELSDMRERLVRTLSPGMKRRVEIARALIHDASVLILDEPTIGLDAQARERIWLYLDAARKARELTLIVTTHYIDEVDGCDRVCIIDNGKILALDTPDALRAAHGREVVVVAPRGPEAAQAILARYPQARTARNGDLTIVGDGQSVMDNLLASHGGDIGHLTFERPSLQSAFLNLTGRQLRAEGPAGRARLGHDEPAM